MYDSMFNVSFVGASGFVGLDPDTRARIKGASMFRLLNSVVSELPNGSHGS